MNDAKDAFINAYRAAKAAFRAYGACNTDQLFWNAVQAAQAYQDAKKAYIESIPKGATPLAPPP